MRDLVAFQIFLHQMDKFEFYLFQATLRSTSSLTLEPASHLVKQHEAKALIPAPLIPK